MNGHFRAWVSTSSVAFLASAAGTVMGQGFTADFEPPAYVGSAQGTIITGQQGWYLPAVGGFDGLVFTYANNTLGVPQNPQGGLQFEAGVGSTNFVRAQHQVDFSTGGMWRAQWDCTGKWVGPSLPAVNNIGSWSQQDSTTTRYFQQLMSWGGAGNPYSGPFAPPPDRLATADRFHIHWGFHTAVSPTTIAFGVPSEDWLDLPVDNWYRVGVKWDFEAAQILEVSIQNLTAGGPVITNDVIALGWYLRGGPNSTLPLPTDIRLFAGGNGDMAAWDNLIIEPLTTGPTCYANCDGSTTVPFLNVADFSCFLSKFAAGDAYANCDGSTTPPVLNVADFSCFLGKFAAGCSAP
jgi:hypothetical protein